MEKLKQLYMKGLPKVKTWESTQSDTTELITARIDEEKIKKISKDKNKFYRWICFILRNEIEVANWEMDPDVDMDTRKVDWIGERIDEHIENQDHEAEKTLVDADANYEDMHEQLNEENWEFYDQA